MCSEKEAGAGGFTSVQGASFFIKFCLNQRYFEDVEIKIICNMANIASFP